ncbi:unnamed protein product [Dovyalis caffra]|uniref:Uncharacterized protein n=1 Tax=Dovyalis caffra TaxID=77055 RepID=A0AAV1SEB0_9ROSI|nr:unnamed protein product [Dovyalis caffra]
MQFSSFSIDKNYVFLLCNGILVLIVKNSGLKISNSHQDTTTSLCGEKNIKSGGSPQKVVEVSDITKPALVAEEKVIMEVKEVQKVVMEEKEVQEAIKDKTLVIAGGDEQGDHEIIVIDEDGEGDEEEVIGLLSTEELNKKCDDFIRKMRDEIKFEAQQLIMVRY